MKKIPLILLVSFLLCIPNVSAKDLKIGYADVLSIFNDYDKTKDYEKALDDKKKSKEEEKKLVQKRDEIIKMQDKLELLEGKEQEKERTKIQNAITEYRDAENKILGDLKKESDEKMQEILKDIESTIKQYAQDKKFDIIFNKGTILYGNEANDVSEDVLNILQKGYKK